jgi:CHC2 zinc finger
VQTISNSSDSFNQLFPVGIQRTISAEAIASIRLAIRLEDIVAERVPLRRSGSAFVGSCPWHQSRSRRSFVVYPQKQTWRCWGCAVGGDVFSFFMRFAGISFPAAVKLVANIAGGTVDGNTSKGVSEQLSTRTELGQVEKQVAKILDAEFMQAARELDRANRIQVRAGLRLAELLKGSIGRFAGETEFCWSALQHARALLPRLDAEFVLLGFGKASDRERFAQAAASERGEIIDEILNEGYVHGDRNHRWEVPLL